MPMTTEFLTKANGWAKVIAIIVALSIAWATMGAKLDGVVQDTAEIKGDIREISRNVGALNSRVSRIEGRLEVVP